MRKFFSTLVFLSVAIIFAGYFIDKNPLKFDDKTLNIYRDIKNDASELYKKGASTLQDILMTYGLIEAPDPNPETPGNSVGDLTKDIVNKTIGKVQSISGMPTYKYTVNNHKEFYDVIYNALNNFEPSVTIRLNNYNEATYSLDVVSEVIYDNFDLDYGVKSTGGMLYSSSLFHAITINFEYGFDRQSMVNMRAASEAKAKEIISKLIKPGMSDIQKERAIHDYVVKNTAYDYKNLERGTLPEEAYTMYGVLVKGQAVCEGYAKAMFKLLNMAGIENKVVIGEADGVPHAWNLVKINGTYTHVDATWDDPITRTNKGILSHKYFNISDQQIAKDHTWDKAKYPKGVSVPSK